MSKKSSQNPSQTFPTDPKWHRPISAAYLAAYLRVATPAAHPFCFSSAYLSAYFRILEKGPVCMSRVMASDRSSCRLNLVLWVYGLMVAGSRTHWRGVCLWAPNQQLHHRLEQWRGNVLLVLRLYFAQRKIWSENNSNVQCPTLCVFVCLAVYLGPCPSLSLIPTPSVLFIISHRLLNPG